MTAERAPGSTLPAAPPSGDAPAEARHGLPEGPRAWLVVNVALFAFLFLADLTAYPGRHLALAAALILSWNGGWFLAAARAGAFPGDPAFRFGGGGRLALALLGLTLAAAGFVAALAVVIPLGGAR